MYQANPDLSPFDIRNMMQETSIYRQCHYMFANEPCLEDLVPKNRQNNVYGHGETRAPESVAEAANYVYSLDLSLNVSLSTPSGMDNKVQIEPGQSLEFALDGNPVEVQWRTWDMRDTWMDVSDFELGDVNVEVSHSMLVDRLQELPDVEIEGNHTVLLRSLRGPNVSTNSVTHIQVIGSEPVGKIIEESAGMVGILSAIVIFMASIIGVLLFILMRNSEHEVMGGVVAEEEIEEIDLVGAFSDKMGPTNSGKDISESTYSKMTVKELQSHLSERGMPTSGRKVELIQRLLDE
jgi:hypothetical protein